jgi:hypothetical protein
VTDLLNTAGLNNQEVDLLSESTKSEMGRSHPEMDLFAGKKKSDIDLLVGSVVTPDIELVAGVSQPEIGGAGVNAKYGFDLLQETPPVSTTNNSQFEFLADLSKPSRVATDTLQANSTRSPKDPVVPSATSICTSSNDLSDIFGASSFDAPLLNVSCSQNATSSSEHIPRVISSPNLMSSTSTTFDPFANLSNRTSGLSVSNQNLQTASKSTPTSTMAGALPNGFKPPTIDINLNSQTQPKTSSQVGQMGPNYSRSFFDQSNNSTFRSTNVNPGFGGIKPKLAESAFDDLLGNS